MRSLRYLVPVLLVATLAFTLAAGCGRAGAGTYPTKPIEVLSHTAAGSSSDLVARIIGDIMEKQKILPQPMAVVNKEGGSGAVAFAYVADKKGDPYTLLIAPPVFITTPYAQGLKFSYKDFTPICNLFYEKTILAVRADSPYKSFKDIIEAAKAKPNTLSQGGGSITAMDNYIRGIIQKATGAQWKYVSFTGSDSATTAVLGGNVDFASPNPSEAMELIRAGKLRPLATTRKLAALPDVPTLEELGYPFPIKHFRGVVAPGGISDEAKKTLVDAYSKVAKTDQWKKYLDDNQVDEGFLAGDDFGKLLGDMDVVLRELTDSLGLKKK